MDLLSLFQLWSLAQPPARYRQNLKIEAGGNVKRPRRRLQKPPFGHVYQEATRDIDLKYGSSHLDGASIYILLCSDGSYYTGITRRSVEERVSEHAQGLMPGYTFTRRP